MMPSILGGDGMWEVMNGDSLVKTWLLIFVPFVVLGLISVIPRGGR